MSTLDNIIIDVNKRFDGELQAHIERMYEMITDTIFYEMPVLDFEKEAESIVKYLEYNDMNPEEVMNKLGGVKTGDVVVDYMTYLESAFDRAADIYIEDIISSIDFTRTDTLYADLKDLAKIVKENK